MSNSCEGCYHYMATTESVFHPLDITLCEEGLYPSPNCPKLDFSHTPPSARNNYDYPKALEAITHQLPCTSCKFFDQTTDLGCTQGRYLSEVDLMNTIILRGRSGSCPRYVKK